MSDEEERKKEEEEELRKAWEARLASNRSSRVTVIDSRTGRKVTKHAGHDYVYSNIHERLSRAGSNDTSAW